ncbi:MAG TPA: hypothetical protein DDW49_11145 [Deltaproteobacteria bacterium]|nr:MAG: hypothetical protein A2048_09245 [Deltaproteobacteria bacterium GWA2_45_12]HBF13921.1 hypothetical protein [Deltaproteobacteria bacterium]
MATSTSKYGILGRLNPEDLYNAFLGLEQRQQVFMAIGLFILLVCLIVLPISCASSKLSELEQTVKKGDQGQKEIIDKIAKYQGMKAGFETLKKSFAKGGSLTTAVESIANQVGIGSNIEQLKPITLASSDYYDEEGVDIVMNAVSLSQLVDFLNKLEHYQSIPIKITKFQIKPRYRRRQELTATLQASTIKLKEVASE